MWFSACPCSVRYANLYDAAVSAVGAYRDEVMAGSFPKTCNSTFMKPAESEKLLARRSGRVSACDAPKLLPSANGVTSFHASGTAIGGSEKVGSSSDPGEPVQTGPYKVCVFGGGRMGQLFAWMMAGPPCCFSDDDRGSAVWQEMQKRETQVTICTSREDLIAACAQAKGLLRVVQSANNSGANSSCDYDIGVKHSFMLADGTVETDCMPTGAEEGRPVNVISRKEAQNLTCAFDLVIIACLSGDTQDIGEPSDLLLDQ